MSSRIALALVLSCSLAAASGQIIGHLAVNDVPGLPQGTMDAIGQQIWLFEHASVGGNMIDGMNALHGEAATRYKLVIAWVGNNSSQADAPPSPTVAGTIYDCNRGNPGWQAKVDIFDNSIRLAGWHAPAITAAMSKMCYIDQDANAPTYLSSMAALESAYPTTHFVYMTMPLMTSSDSDNVLRNQYNAAVRSYCVSNNRLLLDIADIEAFDPNGTPCTFTYNSQTWQRMYPSYSSDGGHLNAVGSRRVALGWYAAAAALIAPPGPCADVDGDGSLTVGDLATIASCCQGPGVPRGSACGRSDRDQDNDVDLQDFATWQVCSGQ